MEYVKKLFDDYNIIEAKKRITFKTIWIIIEWVLIVLLLIVLGLMISGNIGISVKAETVGIGGYVLPTCQNTVCHTIKFEGRTLIISEF